MNFLSSTILIFIKSYMSFEMTPNNFEFDLNKFLLIHSSPRLKNSLGWQRSRFKLFRWTQHSKQGNRHKKLSIWHTNIWKYFSYHFMLSKHFMLSSEDWKTIVKLPQSEIINNSCWTLDVSRTASCEITLVHLSVYYPYSWPWYLMTDETRFKKKMPVFF